MDINELILKFKWRGRRPRIANTIQKQDQNQRADATGLKSYYKTTGIKLCGSGDIDK